MDNSVAIPNWQQIPLPSGSSTSMPTQEFKGEMFTVQDMIPKDMFDVIGENEVKRKLGRILIEHLSTCNNKYIEYTKQYDPATDTMVVRARLFLLSDDKIRILRMYGVNNV